MSTIKQELQGRFHDIKGRVRNQFGELTDDDFERAGGNVEHLVGIIQERTGRARREIENFVNQAISEGKTMAKQATETAKNVANQGVEAARGVAGQAGDTARTMANQATDAARNVASQAGETLREGYEQISRQARDGYEQAESMIRRSPGESILVALGAGLVVGAILGMLISRPQR